MTNEDIKKGRSPGLLAFGGRLLMPDDGRLLPRQVIIVAVRHARANGDQKLANRYAGDAAPYFGDGLAGVETALKRMRN